MKCPSCGYENRANASFCQSCGTSLPTNPGSPPPNSGTRPLSGVNTNFAPLPEGALLNQGQYVVWDVQETSAHMNVYRVEPLTPERVCPHCHNTFGPDEKACSSCGTTILDTQPLHPRYRVRESLSDHEFAMEAHILTLDLECPGLLLPHHFFAEAPYGPTRYYLVDHENLPPLAASLHVPQELARVLHWGESLAQALDYLHQHYITFQDIGLKHIAVQQEKAYWANLGLATIIPGTDRSQADHYFSQDLQGLAATLVYLAAGNQQFEPDSMPEPAARAFSQALAGHMDITASDFAAAMTTGKQVLGHSTAITLVTGHRTDVGQRRSLNEDSLLSLTTFREHNATNIPVGLFAVADGMGGHAAGDVASQLTIQAIEQFATNGMMSQEAANHPLPDTRTWLSTAVMTANQTVYRERQSAGTDMGTTLVMALVVGNAATIANVGDSRAYVLKPDQIVQITTDHSLVERLVATGQITSEEAAHHPQRNVIYRVIGDRPETEADLFTQWLSPNEALLLCSDGLSGMIPDQQIWEMWKTSTSPQQACDRLVAAANQAGGADNITAIIVQLAE